MRRAVSAMVVSGDTVTISVVITDLAGIVMCTAPARRACTIPGPAWRTSMCDGEADIIQTNRLVRPRALECNSKRGDPYNLNQPRFDRATKFDLAQRAATRFRLSLAVLSIVHWRLQ